MADSAPIEVVWDGQTFRPTNGFWTRRAGKQYAEGEIVHIVNQEPRSMSSHRHYFACVEEAWRNLPEDMQELWPTSEHLRKYALIRTGWCNSQTLTASSKAEALRLAAFIRPMDEFALVDVKGQVVTVYTAKTQSFRMGKQDFQRSKDDVLGFLSGMIHVTAQQLTDAGKAA